MDGFGHRPGTWRPWSAQRGNLNSKGFPSASVSLGVLMCDPRAQLTESRFRELSDVLRLKAIGEERAPDGWKEYCDPKDGSLFG